MNNNESCIHGGVSPVALLTNLHHSQSGSGRYRCPTCAYEQGFILGSTRKWKTYASFCESLKDYEICKKGSIAPTRILLELGDNQGGAAKHKCTNCAFKEGFQVGLLGNDVDEINLELIT